MELTENLTYLFSPKIRELLLLRQELISCLMSLVKVVMIIHSTDSLIGRVTGSWQFSPWRLPLTLCPPGYVEGGAEGISAPTPPHHAVGISFHVSLSNIPALNIPLIKDKATFMLWNWKRKINLNMNQANKIHLNHNIHRVTIAMWGKYLIWKMDDLVQSFCHVCLN